MCCVIGKRKEKKEETIETSLLEAFTKVCELVHREQENINVVWQRLGKAVKRVESVAGKRSRDLPPMMGLVDPAIVVKRKRGRMRRLPRT